MQQGKAKIFLNEERGLHEAEWFRSFRTFNFGNYFNENKYSFGDLYVLNDDTLAGNQSLKMNIEEDSFVILLPVTGAVKFKSTQDHDELINAGQALIFNALKGTVIEIVNPYDAELVNFLQVWIKMKPGTFLFHAGISNFDLDDNKNKLTAITRQIENDPALPFSSFIGKFAGRTDLVYKLKKEKAGVFVYIIEGAFEVQNRLMHAKDGLALWDVAVIEAEALSNDAILLIIELQASFNNTNKRLNKS